MYKISTLIVLASLFFLAACSESKFDYRHKYVGDYQILGYRISETGSNRDDTLFILANGSVDFSEARKSLIFDFPDWDIFFEAEINRKAELSIPDIDPEDFSGEFSSNDNFEIINHGFDLVGGAFRNELYGHRQ